MNIYWKKEWTTPAAVGVVSFGVGFGAGCLFWRKKNDRDIEKALSVINDASFVNAAMVDQGETFSMSFKIENKVEEPPKLANIIRPDIKDLGVIPDVATTWNEIITIKDLPTGDGREKIQEPEDAPEESTPERQNVFDDDWDIAEEMANRSPDAPYVIHVNEYFDRELGLPQSCLTWYEGDKILADENNVPVYAYEKIVGVLPFGRGSRDADTVYIRNETMRAEYEITRIHGSYMVEVMGQEIEDEAEQQDLKHSNSVRRFRPSD